MDRLLDVVRLDVGKRPDVARVLAQRMPGVLSGARPLPGALAGILRRPADRVEVEDAVVAVREPEDHLVAAGEAFRAVQPVLEVPDDAVPQPERRIAYE